MNACISKGTVSIKLMEKNTVKYTHHEYELLVVCNDCFSG